MLNLEESPPEQPYFDMSKLNRSDSSLSVISHSSPIMIPRAAKKNISFTNPAYRQRLPAGTVPNSPAPLQKALKNDLNILVPTPSSSPEFDISVMVEPIPTPMPGTTFTFEDINSDIVLLPPPAKPFPSTASHSTMMEFHEDDGVDKSRIVSHREGLRKVCAIRMQTIGSSR